MSPKLLPVLGNLLLYLWLLQVIMTIDGNEGETNSY